MAADPRLVNAIRQIAPPQLRSLLLATALVESGGRLNAVGDSGHSGGPYQENDRGRGAGIPMAQRFDPVASTRRATREFMTFYNEGFRGPELAYRAQRPANREAYIQAIRAQIPVARRLLGAPPPAASRGGVPRLTTDVNPAAGLDLGLSDKAMQAIADYLNRTEAQAMAGIEPEDPGRLIEMLSSFQPEAEPVVPDVRVAGPGRPPGRGGRLAPPLPTPMPTHSEFSIPDPEGAPGAGGRYHAALDWFAPAGTPVRAPAAGRVVEVRPSRGNTGQVFGGTVKLQLPDGRVFVARHVDPRVQVGATIPQGGLLATVTPWRSGRSHAHIEFWRSLAGGYRVANMIDPLTLFR